MPGANTERRKLAAIMFTDMVGYSALAQRDEALALELLEEHRRLLRAVLPKYQGQEIKTTGDGFLLEFSSALAAVQGAVEIQQTLAERNQSLPAERHVRIRIGIHLGDIVWSEGDVYGDGVNIAARIEPLAEPGGICITRAVWEQVQNKLDQAMVRFGAAELKNIELPVEVFRVVMPGQAAVPSRARRSKVIAACVIVAGLLSGGTWLLFHRPASSRSALPSTKAPTAAAAASVADQKSIAVLPFVNMSSDKENEYLSDGITEELLNALAKVPGLRVPARTSAFVFKGKNEDIRKIGELLHVGTILEGSVRRSGDRLRITAQLINVADGFHLWSEQFDREMKDVFAIQDEITRTIVAKLKVTLGGPTGQQPIKHGTENIEAYQLFLKGRFHAERYTRESLQQAVTEFQQAVEKQPDYARAYAGLVYAYGLQQFFGYASPKDVLPRMQAAGQKAMQLDNKLADPHLMAGYGHCYVNWNWSKAEESFKRAVELEPSNPDTHRGYADFLTVRGRFQEALTEITIAKRLDPLSEMLKLREGWIFFRAGQNDRALEIGRQMTANNPDDFGVRELVSFALFRKGQRAEAIAEMEAAVRPGAGGLELARLGRLYGLAGKKADAQRVLRQLQEQARQNYVPAFCLADVYEGLGDFEQANVWMNKAIENRESPLVYLKVDTDDLNRANPHFAEWLKKIGFDK
jgi:TolB-like protein/class 3 adenylate cyclase/tetratricopeptide (TPR) repeat protein